jgi:hypothetical protein
MKVLLILAQLMFETKNECIVTFINTAIDAWNKKWMYWYFYHYHSWCLKQKKWGYCSFGFMVTNVPQLCGLGYVKYVIWHRLEIRQGCKLKFQKWNKWKVTKMNL